MTALGLYACEINGHPVGDQVFAPGWTVTRKRVYYQSYDVLPLLSEGDNALGVTLGDGWYCGYIAWLSRQNGGDFPEFLGELELVYEDGAQEIIGTDKIWRTTAGPVLHSDLLMGEAHDARQEIPNWSCPDLDDSDWTPVQVGPEHDLKIEQSPAPPVRRIEWLPARTETRRGGDECPDRIFDFGQNFTGRVHFCFEGTADQKLTFNYAEILDADGGLYLDNLRGAKAEDEYICSKNGPVVWEPIFTFHGFRYVRVRGLSAEAACSVEGVVLHNDLPRTGHFNCSHSDLNQLSQNILWGQKSNYLEVPMDCPQRDERLGWTGDAQVFMRTGAFFMDVRGFFAKWLQDLRDEQADSGAFPKVAPDPGLARPDNPNPALCNYNSYLETDMGAGWSDAALICPWTIYQCYGNADILEASYQSMAKYMAFLERHKVKDFIRAHPDVDSHGGLGDWLALDERETPKDLIGTAYYANNADIMARTAVVLGKPDDAERYRVLHSNIQQAFQDRFVRKDGVVANGSQTSYVLALHFQLVPEELRAAAAAHLVNDIKSRDMHLATGFLGTPYLLDVLEREGHLETAYALLEQDTYPAWLYPVTLGATTMWERWDGWTPEKGFQDPGMNSFNHYALGSVGSWMVRRVAGLDIDPERPGYAQTLFCPRPGGSLTHAEARIQTDFGEHGIRWEIVGADLHVQLTLPEGRLGTFSSPKAWPAGKLPVPAGETRWILTPDGAVREFL